MIFHLIANHPNPDFKLTTEIARLLFAGIVGDTGRFLYPSPTAQTFEVASKLVQYPFDRCEIYNNMYEMRLPLAKFKGHLLDQLEVDDIGVVSNNITQYQLNHITLTDVE